jgi:hypothetical protein
MASLGWKGLYYLSRLFVSKVMGPATSWKGLTLSSPKNCSIFGMGRVNPFQSPKIVAYEGQN